MALGLRGRLAITVRAGSDARVRVDHVSQRFENRAAAQSIDVLHDVTLDVAAGEFLSVVGPSGCGKTTLLRIVAGLIAPTSGVVYCDADRVLGPSKRMAMVFQSDNLMPWRRVRENVSLGPELRGETKGAYAPRVDQLIELVGLAGFGEYFPHQLSGGMRQRVNLARALAVEPEVLLMDEPFASLDAQTREIMQDELLRIWRETGKSVVFITHQIDEALFLADRLVIMSARPGRVQEIIPVGIDRPRTLDVKRSPRFTEAADHVWHAIEQQVRASIRLEQSAHGSSPVAEIGRE